MAVATLWQLLERARIGLRSLMQGDDMALRFRCDEGTALSPGEFRMHYRIQDQRPKFATNIYFFQEGTTALYTGAKYREFRVGADGESILTGLRGPNREPLGVGVTPPGVPLSAGQ